MITLATLDRVRYPPELLPQASFHGIAAGAEVAPPILELRRFHDRLLRLSEIAVERDGDVELRIRADDIPYLSGYNIAGGFLDLTSVISPAATSFQMLARDRLYYNLFSTVIKTNFRTSYSLWVQKLTVADKLKLGMTLTDEEKALDSEFGVSKSVEKGILPLPLEQQIEREYRSQLISEETHGRTLAVTAVSQVVETMYPKQGQFLVLTKLAATPGVAADDIDISISRDSDLGYVTGIKSFSVGLERDLSCFIPALSELTLNIVAAGAVAVDIRYTIWRVKLSNLLRARFGLELPPEREETIRRVKAGIL